MPKSPSLKTISGEMNNTITEKEILKISTELQCELIKTLVITEVNADILISMLSKITKKAHERLEADECSIFVNDKENNNAVFSAGTGHNDDAADKKPLSYKILPPDKVPIYPKKEQKLGITGWIISTGRSFISSKMDDLNKHPHHIGLGIPEDKVLSAFLGVPLRTPRGMINGAIKAERYNPKQEFTVIEQILLENLAQIAGRCIAHVLDANKGLRQKNAAIIAWALDVIGEAVSSEEELDAFLNMIVKVISAASNADACSIYLIDESKKTLTQRAGIGSQGLQKGIRSYKLPEYNPELKEKLSNLKIKVDKNDKIGITPWLAYTEKSHYARNFEELKKHPYHTGKNDIITFLPDEKCGCWYGIPVRIGGNTIGVLKIENISPKYGTDDREFSIGVRNRVDTLSQNIALAIERSQFRIKSGTNILQDASKTIFKILRGNTAVKDLVKNVVQETAKLFNARACALFLREGKHLIQPEWAAFGWALKGEKVRKYDLVNKNEIKDKPTDEEKVGLTIWIAVKNKKFSARSNLELTMHPHHKGTFDTQNFKEGEKCESFMGVPMYAGDELIGVLKVETKVSRDQKEFTYFSEQDLLALEFIANSAAIAIQNSRLVESNVLADRILVQHDNTNVLRELYEFISGRAEWVNTLDSTKTIVDRKNQDKAKIIGYFVRLLEPDFQILHLEQLIPLIGDERTKNFFEFIIKAIKAGTLTEIIHFDLQVLFSFNWKTDHFLNNISILLGSDIIVKIIDYLKQYDSTVGTRFRLENVIKALNDKALKERIEGMNPFDISIIKKVLSNIERVVNVYYKQFHRVKSPYRTGLPLEPDSKLFFGRNDIFKWIETKINADKHNVLVLHGGSRTGKTSILKQLEAGQSGSVLRNRENAPIFPVFIDLQSFADCNTEIFLFTLAEKIWEKHEIFRTDIAEPKPTDFQNGLHYRAFEKFLKNVTKLLLVRNKSTLVLMLDEFETIEDLINKKKLENSIYGFLRSQMQHQNSITYILAGHYKLSEFKNAEIAVILNIADHMEVGFLSKLDTTKLITEPVKLFAIEYPQDFIEKIYMATNGHPFFVQQICNNCIEILNERREYYQMGEEVLQEAIDKSIDPGSVSVLNKLWDSSNKLEKKILKIISEKVSQGSVWLNVEEIKNEIITKEFEENEVYSAIERLNKKQLIHFDIIANRVKFAFDLFRLYILKHKHRTT